MSEFTSALEAAGIRVDGAMKMAGGVSLFYYRDPDSHREQVRTVAVTLADHRRIISEKSILSFTALSSNQDRHGVGHVTREWADRYANGSLAESEYVQKVMDTYGTV